VNFTPPYPNPYPNWDPMAYLNGLHTRQIMKLRDEAHHFGHGQTSIDDGGWCVVTHDQIKEVLATREHIPNKIEAKRIRQQKAHAKRHR
jgi:hypothetical protein